MKLPQPHAVCNRRFRCEILVNLRAAIREAEQLISNTPTSPERNAICDAHIHMREALTHMENLRFEDA